MRRFVSVGTCCIRVSSLVPHCRHRELELDPFPHQQSKAAFVARMQNVELQPQRAPTSP